MSKVTVVIPNFNGKKYLIPCLESLIKQSFRDFTVVIVDNGSTDGSMELLSSWMTEKGSVEEARDADTTCVPKIRCLSLGHNTGFSHAVNVGIQEAKGEYVFLLNNDTQAEKDSLRRLVRFMDSHPGAFSAGAKMTVMSDPKRIDGCGDYYNALGYAFSAGKGKRADRYTREKKIFSACAGAAMYRVSALQETGLFDENHFAYLEDVDIGYRAKIKGFSNYIVPSAVVLHAGSAVSGSRHNAFKVSLASKNSMYLIYKNQPLLQQLINLPLVAAGCTLKLIFFSRKGLGGVYAKGIGKGIVFCFSKEARRQKVRFEPGQLRCYLKIQAELWINVARMIFG